MKLITSEDRNYNMRCNMENRTSTELHNRKGRTTGWEGDNSSIVSGLVLLTECTLEHICQFNVL